MMLQCPDIPVHEQALLPTCMVSLFCLLQSFGLLLLCCYHSGIFSHPSHNVGLIDGLQLIITFLFWMETCSSRSTFNHFLEGNLEVTSKVLGDEMSSNKRSYKVLYKTRKAERCETISGCNIRVYNMHQHGIDDGGTLCTITNDWQMVTKF